jgi:hypothetical protein
MFVDYENLYSVLTSQSSKEAKTSEYATEILDEVQRYLQEGDDTPTIFGRAYGPFDVLLDTEDSGVPAELHRHGINPSYVPAAMQGNTSEIQLTVEVTQFLHERPDVQTIVIVTGDRPYLPLVRTIQEQGRRALVAAVNPPQTDRYVESDLYLDARNLLSADSREDLLANAPRSGTSQNSPSSSTRYEELTDAAAQRAIEITEEHFGQYEEVYLTPLLRKLSDLMGPDEDPKELVSILEAAGAVRLEKRSGYPYDYTVLIVHDDHPDVRAVQSGRRSTPQPSSDATEEPSTTAESEPNDTDDSPDEAYEPYDYDEYTIDEALSADSDEDSDPEPAVSTEVTDGTPSPDDAPLTTDEDDEDR